MFYIVYYFISLEFGEAIVYGVNVPKLTQVYGNQTYRKNINSYCSIKLEKGIFFKMKFFKNDFNQFSMLLYCKHFITL